MAKNWTAKVVKDPAKQKKSEQGGKLPSTGSFNTFTSNYTISPEDYYVGSFESKLGKKYLSSKIDGKRTEDPYAPKKRTAKIKKWGV